MLSKKHKYLHKIFISVIAGLLITTALIVVPKSASAFDPACTPPALGAGNGSASSCFDSSGKPWHPVVDNKDNSPSPEKGHCYNVKNSAFGFVYYNADCSKPPFNANFRSVTCTDGSVQNGSSSDSADKICKSHGGAEVISQTPPTQAVPLDISCDQPTLDQSNCGIIRYLVIVINTLSALVAVVVVIVIIVAGIQWTTAGNNPQQLAAAKSRIVNALLALLVFIFMFAFLQWIVPGGIF